MLKWIVLMVGLLLCGVVIGANVGDGAVQVGSIAAGVLFYLGMKWHSAPLELKPGATYVLRLPGHATAEHMEQIRGWLAKYHPECKFIVLCGARIERGEG